MSITECCFKNTVDRQMETIRMAEPARTPGIFLKGLTFHDGDVGADGVVHMDAGEYVGRRIRLVQGGNHAGKYILTRVNGRSEICSVVEKGTDNQADGHAGEQEGAQPVKNRVYP